MEARIPAAGLGEQLHDRSKSSNGQGCPDSQGRCLEKPSRSIGEAGDGGLTGFRSAGVAARVTAMQQQLDVQLALSKTLTESLTGMLDQATSLRLMLETALQRKSGSSADNSNPIRNTSSSATCKEGNAAEGACIMTPKRQLSNSDANSPPSCNVVHAVKEPTKRRRGGDATQNNATLPTLKLTSAAFPPLRLPPLPNLNSPPATQPALLLSDPHASLTVHNQAHQLLPAPAQSHVAPHTNLPSPSPRAQHPQPHSPPQLAGSPCAWEPLLPLLAPATLSSGPRSDSDSAENAAGNGDGSGGGGGRAGLLVCASRQTSHHQPAAQMLQTPKAAAPVPMQPHAYSPCGDMGIGTGLEAGGIGLEGALPAIAAVPMAAVGSPTTVLAPSSSPDVAGLEAATVTISAGSTVQRVARLSPCNSKSTSWSRGSVPVWATLTTNGCAPRLDGAAGVAAGGASMLVLSPDVSVCQQQQDQLNCSQHHNPNLGHMSQAHISVTFLGSTGIPGVTGPTMVPDQTGGFGFGATLGDGGFGAVSGLAGGMCQQALISSSPAPHAPACALTMPMPTLQPSQQLLQEIQMLQQLDAQRQNFAQNKAKHDKKKRAAASQQLQQGQEVMKGQVQQQQGLALQSTHLLQLQMQQEQLQRELVRCQYEQQCWQLVQQQHQNRSQHEWSGQ